ncbi:hypothetical protein BN14_08426 [Rhizoctonia solani AG-1 IB]|uniref:Uncharacterized protein n=1 Tax=Thanatephorus cucumeris (strain AG1-IB / isolate 7/3/14) TaxID=1108050 RepID=M5C4S6_THACB|nr:hypothetical protein BN14_08426 [Rhizoctonia solani AG-1 IB]
MDFGWWSDNQRAWHDLVSQVKPLTDRIWTNIQPKLIPLLETNRQQRLEVEREKRQSERRRALSKLFLEMKEQSFPALRFNAHNPVARLSSSMPTIRVIHQEPFPDFSHALNWPLIKDLYETDVSATEMEAKFSQHRDEVLALVTEWKGQIQSQLVSLLRTALDDKDETLRPTISISNEEPNPLANVSDDTKLLLRADSLFHNPTPPMVVKQPLTYGSILSWKDLMGSRSLYGSSIAQTPPNFDNIQWYAEAHEVAREILADLGKPDASYLEMKSVGSVFVCGRCHEISSRTWEAMVQHYVEHKRIYAELQKDGSPLSEHEITYRNVHDPQLFTDRPMITDFATKTLENESSLGVGRSQLCKLHEITEPKVDEHYTVRSWGAISLDTDDYDSDDSYYMGHGGCNCPFHQMFGGPGYGDGYGYSDEDDDGFGLGLGLGFGYDDEDEDEDGYGLGSDEDYL